MAPYQDQGTKITYKITVIIVIIIIVILLHHGQCESDKAKENPEENPSCVYMVWFSTGYPNTEHLRTWGNSTCRKVSLTPPSSFPFMRVFTPGKDFLDPPRPELGCSTNIQKMPSLYTQRRSQRQVTRGIWTNGSSQVSPLLLRHDITVFPPITFPHVCMSVHVSKDLT